MALFCEKLSPKDKSIRFGKSFSFARVSQRRWIVETDPHDLSMAQKKTKQIFSWLKAFHQARSKHETRVEDHLWHVWLRSLPNHPSIHYRRPREATSDEECFLAVRRPDMEAAPQPPQGLLPWLEEGWDDPFKDVSLKEDLVLMEKGSAPFFEDKEDRDKLFEGWIQKREAWVKKERPVREARQVFEDFYRLYADIERESENVELILGDGILRWQVDGHDICHPMLLKRVRMEFDPKRPAFLLMETDDEVEFYSGLLGGIQSLIGSVMKAAREEFSQGDFHPLDSEPTSGFLQGLVHKLSPNGEFIEGRQGPLRVLEDPTICRDPILFLRKRELKYNQAIDSILEILEGQASIPQAFWRFVGIEQASPQKPGREDRQGPDPWHGLEEVVFTKPWNAEQLRIVHSLDRQSTVLVQGPPGTGKTHTIANLIGHFLATGQSVLVAAHTSKALRVLRDKVVPDLRPLCVSVLDDEAESKRQLEASVEKIVEHLDSDDPECLKIKAGKTQSRRLEILRDLSCGWQKLKEVRSLEYRDMTILGTSYKPSEAAKKIYEGKGKHDWIPDGIPPDMPCPLTLEEVLELYRLSALLTPQDEHDVRGIAKFLEGSEEGLRTFLAEDPFGMLSSKRPHDSSLWKSEPIELESIRLLMEKLDKERAWLEELRQKKSWELGALEASVCEDGAKNGWKSLLKAIEELTRASQKIGRFAFLKKRKLEKARVELGSLWDTLMPSFDLPRLEASLEEGERELRYFGSHLQEVLSWSGQTWEPIRREFEALGFRWEACFAKQAPKFVPFAGLERFLGAMEEAKQALQERLETLEAAQDHFYGLLKKMDQLERKEALLAKLESCAPHWALMIRERQGVHALPSPPSDPREAWLFGHLQAVLDERHGASPEEIEERIEALQAELMDANTELARSLAWGAQIKKTGLLQRQALVGWLNIIQRIGKGTGKRVPRLKQEARKKMEECRQSVPVWIMPIAKVVETFDPKKTRFDVVIIDEASQSDLRGLCALFMADRAIVVGDDKQVSPSDVGSEVQIQERLIDEHLEGIPDKILYDGRSSVYTLAWKSFGISVCLLEHFRCVSDIIAFSNELCYDGKIKPLRDASTVQTAPFVVPYKVEGAFREGKVNPKEALTVASLLKAAIEQPEYKDATFGVISLLGDDQALEIDRILRRLLQPEVYKKKRILCAKPPQFQGDERNVIFLSMVDVPQDGPLRKQDHDAYRQWMNVAASRACEQMWVVHSLDPNVDLKPDDLRRRLIEHALDPRAAQRAFEAIEKRAESQFEKDVAQRLLARGYRVRPQWEVGAYRIDLVVVDGEGKKVAIECDGDRYHTQDNLDEDMARQLLLEKLGWRFLRIRGSEFYRDPEAKMHWVEDNLERLGIIPFEPSETLDPMASSSKDELKERIMKRAAEIRCGEGLATEEELPGPLGIVGRSKESLVRSNPEKPSKEGIKRRGVAASKSREMIDGQVAPPDTAKEIKEERELLKARNPKVPSRTRLVKPELRESAKNSPDPLLEAIERLIPSKPQCPSCKRESRIFIGRKGPFLGCGNSSCTRTQSVSRGMCQQALDALDVRCPTCRAPMKAIFGNKGTFVGCTAYPACKTPLSWRDLRFLLRERAMAAGLDTEYRP